MDIVALCCDSAPDTESGGAKFDSGRGTIFSHPSIYLYSADKSSITIVTVFVVKRNASIEIAAFRLTHQSVSFSF